MRIYLINDLDMNVSALDEALYCQHQQRILDGLCATNVDTHFHAETKEFSKQRGKKKNILSLKQGKGIIFSLPEPYWETK